MKRLLGALLGAAAIAGSAGYWLRRSLPRHRGTVRLAGIDSEIEIVRDRWSIPHIFAASTSDLFFGQGYATAQDRLWQMEIGRRVASGTLSGAGRAAGARRRPPAAEARISPRGTGRIPRL